MPPGPVSTWSESLVFTPTVIKERVLCLVIMGRSFTGSGDVTKFPAEA